MNTLIHHEICIWTPWAGQITSVILSEHLNFGSIYIEDGIRTRLSCNIIHAFLNNEQKPWIIM